MLDRKQKQSQTQNIISESHGIINEVHCPYYTDERSEHFKQTRNLSEGAEAVKNKELYYKSQLVSRTIYEGKTVKISCHLFGKNGNKCKSPLNESKICHLI